MTDVGQEDLPVEVERNKLKTSWFVVERNEYARAREQALTQLQREGFLRFDEGQIVVDLESFKSRDLQFYRSLRKRIGPLATSSKYGNNAIVPTFFHIFRDLQVYSEEDHMKLKEGQTIEPRRLFYLPQNAETALSESEIQNDRSYLGFWELVGGIHGNYPTLQEGLQSGLSSWEAAVSYLTYHRDRGNGVRDEQGKLKVTYPDGSQRPITSDFFLARGYNGAPGMREVPIWRTREFLAERCPRLLEKNLLRTEDFKVQKGYQTAERFRVGGRSLTRRGMVMFEGTRYTLGAEYGQSRFSAYQLSPDLAGIVERTEDGGMRLVKVFELSISDPTKAKIYKGEGGEYSYVNRGGFREYSPTQIAEENPLYAATVKNFEGFLEFSERVSREVGLNLSQFSVTEQWFAAAVYQEYGEKQRFWKFLKNYGLPGLRSLMAMEGSLGNAELVLEIGEKTDAKRLFAEVGGIVEAVTKYEGEVRERLPEGERVYADDVAALVLKHTNRLLLAAVPVLRGEIEELDIHDAVFAVRSFRDRVAEMYRSFFGLHVDEGKYRQLLEVFQRSTSDPNLGSLALATLEHQWLAEIDKENQETLRSVLKQSDRFYEGNEALFATASQTTADTRAELTRFQEYLGGREVDGTVLDIGCGDGKRMTTPMAEMLLRKARVIGVDRVRPTAERQENLDFVQGDLTKLPLPDSSVSLMTAHWSVVNDLLLRWQELGAFDETARVLRKGGDFYFDVPYLEGGEKSWDETAKAFRKEHPASRYGMIVANFPGERAKHFQILPEVDLDAMLESSGFSVNKKDFWRTEAGKPRLTYIARLERKITPRRLH